jgi:hypothetical protein
MNAEVIKAMNKKEKKHNFRKWWDNNGYKVMRVILFPIWIFTIIYKKTNIWLDSRQQWNEEKAKEIFNYYIPRKADWGNISKSFYFFDNGMGWGVHSAKKYLKRKDRRFWDNHNGFCGGTLRDYLIEKFELEGFTKIVGECSDGWTEIEFVLKEK